VLYVWNKEKECIKFFITDWLLSYAFQLHRLKSIHERHMVMSGGDKVMTVQKEILAHFMMTSWCQSQQAK